MKSIQAAVCVFVLVLCIKCPTAETMRNGECAKKLAPVTVEWPGCEPTSIRVPECLGTCESNDMQSPTCCKPDSSKTSGRLVTFICNGERQSHTIYFQKIESCACLPCGV